MSDSKEASSLDQTPSLVVSTENKNNHKCVRPDWVLHVVK